MSCEPYDCIVIGGGIAGISALEEIYGELPEAHVLLLSGSAYVKISSVRFRFARRVEELDVKEKSTETLTQQFPKLSVVSSAVLEIVPKEKSVITIDRREFKYRKLCICTGAVPKLLTRNNPYVIGIRDTDSAVHFQEKLKNSKQIVIVGNGGIATELAYQLKGIQIIWVVRHKHISAAFLDAGAGQFFLDLIKNPEKKPNPEESSVSRSQKYTISRISGQQHTVGCALGPNWQNELDLRGSLHDSSIDIEFETEVDQIVSSEDATSEDLKLCGQWPVYVKLTNGKIYGCDFIVSATGVEPFVPPTREARFAIGDDGGVLVNDNMETSIPDIFAAGDVCTVNWETPPNWFQMRLWTQARLMGAFSGRCIAASLKNDPKLGTDFGFELFSHVTRFFGFKVVLLGLFNGQTLNGQYEVLVRVTPGTEYVKLVIKDGRVRGAVLVGETDLEETIENLILNEVDVSIYGDDLLNPDIDIEDYFD